MGTILLIHNPGCTKSQSTLKLLQSKGIEPQIVDYLNGGLTRDLLSKIIAGGVKPKDLIRTKEEEFQILNINFNNVSEVIDAILIYPKLLERPIVLKGQRAVIGRPLENVLDLINHSGTISDPDFEL